MPRPPVPILSVLRPRTAERFLAKLKKSRHCLLFTGTKNKSGYGFVDVSYDYSARRYAILAHRLAWVLANGREVPPDKLVLHRCNRPSCCNPKHLYIGTHQDNADDKVRAGRQGRAKPLLGRRGTAHPASRYTAEQRAEAIRLRAQEGCTFERIAAHLKTGRDTPSRWWREYEASLK